MSKPLHVFCRIQVGDARWPIDNMHTIIQKPLKKRLYPMYRRIILFEHKEWSSIMFCFWMKILFKHLLITCSIQVIVYKCYIRFFTLPNPACFIAESPSAYIFKSISLALRRDMSSRLNHLGFIAEYHLMPVMFPGHHTLREFQSLFYLTLDQ